MKRLFAALALACAPAFADPLFESGQLTVTFHASRCELAHLTNFLKQYGTEPKKASVVFQGQRVRACYVVDEDGDYIVADELGSGGVIPGKAINPGV